VADTEDRKGIAEGARLTGRIGFGHEWPLYTMFLMMNAGCAMHTGIVLQRYKLGPGSHDTFCMTPHHFVAVSFQYTTDHKNASSPKNTRLGRQKPHLVLEGLRTLG
jgi:hypothetical protein